MNATNHARNLGANPVSSGSEYIISRARREEKMTNKFKLLDVGGKPHQSSIHGKTQAVK